MYSCPSTVAILAQDWTRESISQKENSWPLPYSEWLGLADVHAPLDLSGPSIGPLFGVVLGLSQGPRYLLRVNIS